MLFAGKLLTNHSLAKYTSWRVGGPADYFYTPTDLADLSLFLSSRPADETLTWLGLGSNVLIQDGGIRGTVIHTLNKHARLACLDNGDVFVEAGVPCAKLAKFCAKRGYEQGAFFAGIPGTVGGALKMNAGAFDNETWAHLVSVTVMDRFGVCTTLSPSDFSVGYREVFGLAGRFFVSAQFSFEAGDVCAAQEKIKALLKQRQLTQPIGTLNCGSVFRNPPGDYAARLIESIGLKGHRIGGASVSLKHANFIVNDADASASDILALIDYVQAQVALKTGVSLVRECIILGETLGG